MPRGGPVVFGAGTLAALGLVGALGLPVRIATLPADGARVALPEMHAWLIMVTLLYLVAGTVFYIARYGDE